MSISRLNARFSLLRHVINNCNSNLPSKCPDQMSVASAWPVIIPKRDRWYSNSKKGAKMAPTKPLNFDFSGDLEQNLAPIDMTMPRVEYRDCEALESSSDVVHKLYSLDFGRNKDFRNWHKLDVVNKINRFDGDYLSAEARVGRLTVQIRNLIKYCLQYRKDKKAKCQLIEHIQMRRKLLKQMKATDYEKFTWLLKELNIVYVPVPEDKTRLTFRQTRCKEATQKADVIREAKIEQFKKSLSAQREEFYKEKDRILLEIEQDLKELDLDGPTLMAEVEREEEEAELAAMKAAKIKFPAVNNKYIMMKFKE